MYTTRAFTTAKSMMLSRGMPKATLLFNPVIKFILRVHPMNTRAHVGCGLKMQKKKCERSLT